MTIVAFSCNANVINCSIQSEKKLFNPIRKIFIQSFWGERGHTRHKSLNKLVAQSRSPSLRSFCSGNERLWKVSGETSQRVDTSSCRTKWIRPPPGSFKNEACVVTRRCPPPPPPSTYEVFTSRSLSFLDQKDRRLRDRDLISSSTGDRARLRKIE